MQHAAEGTLLEWLDGRLPRAEHAAVQGHVAACASCAAQADRLRALSSTFDGAMALLDPPAPVLPAYAAVLRRRRAGWMHGSRRALARAAMLVLGVAGVASATLPGSPVREWIEERFGAGAATSSTGAPPAAPAGPTKNLPAAPAEAMAGVEILPLDGTVRVMLNDVSPQLKVRVRLADAEYVDVRGTGGAADARFRTAPGRVSISDAGAGEIQIALPRAVRRATILVGGRTYMVKEGEQIRVLAPAADTAGAEIVFPVGP